MMYLAEDLARDLALGLKHIRCPRISACVPSGQTCTQFDSNSNSFAGQLARHDRLSVETKSSAGHFEMHELFSEDINLFSGQMIR